jgi:ABC-2 type transport system permease protein
VSLFFFQLGNELRKLFARKRTYIGFGAFLLVEILILFLLNLPKPKAGLKRIIEQNGYVFEQYFSGVTLAFLILMWTTLLLGGLYLALVAGDVVSKEVEDGTMRMILCRPASRVRIGVLKCIACIIYTFALSAFVGLSALVASVLYKGFGGLFAFAPMEHVFALHEPWPGLWRYLGALLLQGFCLATISSLGFMLSSFNMKPAAATITTLSVIFLGFILGTISYFESFQSYIINTHMSAWLLIFDHRIPWSRIVEHCLYLLGFDVSFVVVGLAAFHQRDFKT